MVVPDAEEVKDTFPDEYSLYQRLGIKSVLAIPLEPRPIALVAVRNPKRYIRQTSMLKLLAYVLLAAYNDKRMRLLKWLTVSRPFIPIRPSSRPLRTLGAWRR